MTKRTGTCTAIALYDLDIKFIQESKNIRKLFYYLENWFNKNTWPPVRMSLDGKNVPKSTQTRTFKYYKKLIEKVYFEEITGFWIGATPPNHNSDLFDSVLSAGLSLAQDSRHKRFALYFHNDIIPHNWDYIESLAKDILQWVKAGYGIAYQRDFDKGPGLYASGMITGPDRYCHSEDTIIERELDNISKWFHIYGEPEDYHHGDLRDIYPLNFLSETHLKRDVHGKTLKEWIGSNSDHGTLKPLTDILWSWRVPEDKIDSIREALKDTGIILCI